MATHVLRTVEYRCVKRGDVITNMDGNVLDNVIAIDRGIIIVHKKLNEMIILKYNGAEGKVFDMTVDLSDMKAALAVT